MTTVCVVMAVCAAAELFPAPQSITLSEDDFFVARPGTPVVVADDATEDEIAAVKALEEALGVRLTIRRAAGYEAGGPALVVGEQDRNVAFRRPRVRRWVGSVTETGAQGYRLVVTRKLVVLAGTDRAGTFYGLQTLRQLARDDGRIPCGRVRDEPAVMLRGVVVSEGDTEDNLRRLAAMRCNLAVFESEDFYGPSEEAMNRWKEIFAQARRLFIEPAPFLALQEGAGKLLARFPGAVSARRAEDRVFLEGDDWVLMPKRHVVDLAVAPIEVTLDGKPCRRQVDYVIEPGDLKYPYRAGGAPWLIRRVPGGAIPDGSVVEVSCLYAPEGENTYCVDVPEGRAMLESVLGGLARELAPKWVHVGRGPFVGGDSDPRSGLGDVTEGERLEAFFEFAEEATGEGERPRWLVWGEQGLLEVLDAGEGDLVERGVVPCRPAEMLGADGGNGAVEWSREHGVPFVLVPEDSLPGAYSCCRRLADLGATDSGVLVRGAAPEEAVRLAMETAWSGSAEALAWPGGLNGYFGVALWKPGYEEVLTALAEHLNRQTLHGVAPEGEYAGFATVASALRGDGADTEREEQLYGALTEWVALEAQFARAEGEGPLRRLAKLVERQASVDPGLDEERLARILEGIEDKGLFVPSSILFRRFVLPYREYRVPPGCRVLEMPVSPDYQDADRRVEATVDLLTPPGPVCRLDFDTVGTGELILERGEDGKRFEEVERWSSESRGGLRGPVLPSRALRSRYLRITVVAGAGRAVLRDLRVFAYKEAPAEVCGYSRRRAVLDGDFKEAGWPKEAAIEGFVSVDTGDFAEVQTTVRVFRDDERLYVGAYAREPRMSTRVVRHVNRDAPVWEDEAFAVVIEPPGRERFRFAVNAGGVRYDGLGGDASWNGNWKAATKDYPEGWAAEIAIPFDELGVAPGDGESWKVDFLRHRRNVTDETSSWAQVRGSRGGGLGRMVFE